MLYGCPDAVTISNSTISTDTLNNLSYIFRIYVPNLPTNPNLDIVKSCLKIGTINNSYITDYNKITTINITESTINVDSINWSETIDTSCGSLMPPTDVSIINAETIKLDTNTRTDLPPPVITQSTLNIGSCINNKSTGTLSFIRSTGTNTLVLQNLVANHGNIVNTILYDSVGDIIIKEVNILVDTLTNNSRLFNSTQNITMANQLVNINSIYNSIGFNATQTVTMRGGSYIIDKFGDFSNAIKAGAVNIKDFSDILLTYARMKFLSNYTIGILTSQLSVDCHSSIVIKNIPYCTQSFIGIAVIEDVETVPTLTKIVNAIYVDCVSALDNSGRINITSSHGCACVEILGVLNNNGEIDINCNCLPSCIRQPNVPFYCCYELPKLCSVDKSIVNKCDQPCNQPVNQPCNQPCNQPVNPPIYYIPTNPFITYNN